MDKIYGLVILVIIILIAIYIKNLPTKHHASWKEGNAQNIKPISCNDRPLTIDKLQYHADTQGCQGGDYTHVAQSLVQDNTLNMNYANPNQSFGDPCYGIVKTVDVDYTCG